MSMHSIRRHESPLDRLQEALGAFLKRRVVDAAGILLIVFSIAATLSLATWSVSDPSWNNATSAPVKNLLGAPGAVMADLLIQVFGLAATLFVVVGAAWGLRLLRRRRIEGFVLRVLLAGAGALALAAAAAALPATTRWPLLTGLGGVVGDGVLGAVRSLLGLRGPTAACSSASPSRSPPGRRSSRPAGSAARPGPPSPRTTRRTRPPAPAPAASPNATRTRATRSRAGRSSPSGPSRMPA